LSGFLANLAALGPVGLLLIAFLDSAGVPIPTAVDAVLLAVSAARPDLAPLAAAASILGSLAGNILLFALARRGGQLYLDRHTQGPNGQRLRRWFHQYGLLTVFIPALVPIPMPMKAFVISSGALGIPWIRFLTIVAAARLLRYPALAWLGSRFGSNAPAFLQQHATLLAFLGAAIAILLVLILRLRRPRA
jgi:membrane protein DedA with SNARE-associated domain